MSFATEALRKRPQWRSLENPNVPLNSKELLAALRGAPADAGVYVTPRNAVNVAAVCQAVQVISGDVARLPAITYKRTEGDGRERATNHPAYRLLRRKANPLMTAAFFKRVLVQHALLWGNGYAWIIRDVNARPIELLLLNPAATQAVLRKDGQLRYVTHVNGSPEVLKPEDVFHLRGPLSQDGISGLSVVDLARNSLGLSMAAEKFGNTFFARGITATGVLQYPGKLDQEAARKFLEKFEGEHASLEKSHRAILLHEGSKFTPLTIPPNNAQFLETRKFQKEEIANWFHLPLHKIGAGDRPGYNSLESENQAYLDSSLEPWLVAFEEEAWDKLLTEAEKQADSAFVEFLREALLRADLTTRYAAYRVGREWGWLSANDVCRIENRPTIGPKGDIYLQPANTVEAGAEPEPEPAPPEDDTDEGADDAE